MKRNARVPVAQEVLIGGHPLALTLVTPVTGKIKMGGSRTLNHILSYEPLENDRGRLFRQEWESRTSDH